MRSGFFAAAASSGSGPGAPGVVTNVTGTAGIGQISVTWSAPVSNGGSALTDYTVQYSSNSGGTWTTFADGVSTATSTTVTGLSAGTSYTFRVLAKNTIGDGPYSAASAAVSAATTPDAPTTVVATQGVGQMGVTWSAPVNNGGSAITDYVVQYSSDSGSNWTTFADGTSASASTTVTGLANNTSYIFRIAAVNIAGTGSYSTASTAVTTAAVPGAPGTPTPTAHQNTQVPLTWSAAASNGSAITDYVVQYSTSATFASAVTTFADGTSASTSATVTGLANGTTYYFRVAAVNAVGTGPYSTISASAVPSTIPDAPATPTITAASSGDTFNWTAPANGSRAITGYVYQISTNDAAFAAEVSVGSGVTSVAIGNQYSTSTFKIKVRAINDNGTSAFSTTSANTVAWTSNTGTETDTDTVCGPAGCSDTENVTETDTETVTETDTDTACGPAGCTDTENCDCGTRSRTRTSSRTRTRTRSRDRTRVRSRTRTRTSSRTRTRSTQYYSRSGSTSSGVTYGSYSAYTDYTYSAWGAYGGYSYTAYTGYGAYYYSAYGAYTDYTYTAYGAFGACSGTRTAVTTEGTYNGVFYSTINHSNGTTYHMIPPGSGCVDCETPMYAITLCLGVYTVTYLGCQRISSIKCG